MRSTANAASKASLATSKLMPWVACWAALSSSHAKSSSRRYYGLAVFAKTVEGNGKRCLMPAMLVRSGALKQLPSLPVRLSPGVRLDLAPVSAHARTVGCIAALAHDAFQAPFLGHTQ
jgi:hypothetical protein